MQWVFMKNKNEVWRNIITDEKIKFSSIKKEENLGKTKSKWIAPKEPALFLVRGGKTNWTGGYLRPFSICLNLKCLDAINKKITLIYTKKNTTLNKNQNSSEGYWVAHNIIKKTKETRLGKDKSQCNIGSPWNRDRWIVSSV